MQEKTCPSCERTFNLTEFPRKGGNGDDTRRSLCRKCHSAKVNTGDSKNRYCLSCKTWKAFGGFDLTGKKTKDGVAIRDSLCSSCRYKNKKNKRILDQVYKQEEQDHMEEIENSLVNAILHLSRFDLNRLDSLHENEFISQTRSQDLMEGISFVRIKMLAKRKMLEMGQHRPEKLVLPAGKYLIVGDSHGRHTPDKMYQLLHNVIKEVGVDKIVHVGHMADDDNRINDQWKKFNNLIILAKAEEGSVVESFTNNSKDIVVVRDEVNIGDVIVTNQDLISDYVKTFIGNLDQEIFPASTIVNSHRHELDTRCTYKGKAFIAAPGCLCEKHITKTIKPIDFEAGYQLKDAKPDGFVKYRRMKHMYEFWSRGMIVVEYDNDGNLTILPYRIENVGGEYVTAYFDKIISSDGVKDPEMKIFVNGDAHVPFHDGKVLDIHEKICEDYKPNVYINIGDLSTCEALNHHIMDKNKVIENKDMLDEMARVNHILRKTSRWADSSYLLGGNHERFFRDFTEKYPQLHSLVDFEFLSAIEGTNFNYIDLKEVLDINDVRFFHGDMFMFGQKGSKTEKASRNFGDDIFNVMGHIHYPSIRFSSYSIGLSGKLDQEYNEVNASRWMHGFAMCNTYKGKTFITTVPLTDYSVAINGKTYQSGNYSSWEMIPSYKAKLQYAFE